MAETIYVVISRLAGEHEPIAVASSREKAEELIREIRRMDPDTYDRMEIEGYPLDRVPSEIIDLRPTSNGC